MSDTSDTEVEAQPTTARAPKSMMAIDTIKIGQRIRRDLGDLTPLMESIKLVGLLHPVPVLADGTLVGGARRLEAARRLGWTHIPVHIVQVDDLLRAEVDENVERVDFSPFEIEEVRKALEAREGAETKARQTAGLRKGAKSSVEENVHHGTAGKTRDRVGAMVGKSGKTVDKIKAVAEAAKREPEKFAAIAEAMEKKKMSVEAAYKKVRGALSQKRKAASKSAKRSPRKAADAAEGRTCVCPTCGTSHTPPAAP